MLGRRHRESDEERIVWGVLRLARALRQPLADEEPIGSALGLLASLQREGPMSAATLARSEGLKPQSVSLVLARLEQDGLVERLIDQADRRRHRIVLTRAGEATLRRAMNRRRKWLAEAMSQQLDDADYRTLVAASDVMLRLAGAVDDHDGE